MKSKKQAGQLELTSELKIKHAARIIFLKKGFAGTKTRDIAEEANINLSLLNYYFRTKRKLFDLIINEKLEVVFDFLGPIIYDDKTNLETKIECIVSSYIDLLISNPDIPLFILGEARSNSTIIKYALQKRKFFNNSVIIKQLSERMSLQDANQFIQSLLGMCIFPIIFNAVFGNLFLPDGNGHIQLMIERKKIIVNWAMMVLKADTNQVKQSK